MTSTIRRVLDAIYDSAAVLAAICLVLILIVIVLMPGVTQKREVVFKED